MKLSKDGCKNKTVEKLITLWVHPPFIKMKPVKYYRTVISLLRACNALVIDYSIWMLPEYRLQRRLHSSATKETVVSMISFVSVTLRILIIVLFAHFSDKIALHIVLRFGEATKRDLSSLNWWGFSWPLEPFHWLMDNNGQSMIFAQGP